ncbi:MAG: MFS transporter [Sarcina sp.]
MTNTKSNYKLTTYSCFVGIFIQAIITNVTAILFVPMMSLYNLSYKHLGILIGVNFFAQIISDIVFGKKIDKLGYKKLVLPAVFIAFLGLILFALTPFIFKTHIFIGLLISTIIFASSSGLLEILLSPIIDSISKEESKNDTAMALMHSFYAWGQVATIIITTLFLFIFGYKSWQFIILFWSIVPLISFFMFVNSKFPKTSGEDMHTTNKVLFKNKIFILCLLAILFGGASEVIMNQWTSTFMENALHLPKITGDLIGMCGFAIMLGIGRTLYGIFGDKFNMQNVLVKGSFFAFITYLLVALSPLKSISIISCILTGFFASLLWPGTLVVTSELFPKAGAWIFAMLAVAGDIGASFGPLVTGILIDYNILEIISFGAIIPSEAVSIRLGLLFGAIFPFLCFLCHYKLKKSINFIKDLS